MAVEMEKYRQKPLYISDFQKWLQTVPGEQKRQVVLCLRLDKEGCCRYLKFAMPVAGALAEMPELSERYLLAMMNNLVVSFGGEKLEVYFPMEDELLAAICQLAVARFQVERPSDKRTEYGLYVNYINRMNPHLGLAPFAIELRDSAAWQEPDTAKIVKICEAGDAENERALLRQAAVELNGRCFCSLDVGGNSIKGAVVQNGEITFLKEHRWYPSGCKTANELMSPIAMMLRLLRACTALGSGCEICLEDVLKANLSEQELEKVVAELEKAEGVTDFAFDAVTIGFPDIVVRGKIAGGETFKQKGIKLHAGKRYEEEFEKTAHLDDMARAYVKPQGMVVVLNDGNAASFITSVEQAFAKESILSEQGMFANTIGTEMGTGFVSCAGTIHYFPLDGYQQVIDLGNMEYARYPAEDIRSVNSRSTGIPGTMQKFVTQLGLFRLAMIGLMERDRKAFDSLMQQGLLEYDEQADRLTVAVAPKDRRGDLTRALMAMLEEGHPVLVDAFHTMGKAMGVHIDQCRLIFPELASTRLLSGGIVAPDRAFKEMVAGLRAYNPDYKLVRLDENLVLSPLLKKMRPHQRNFNVAIGSAYIGSYALLAKQRDKEEL